MVDEQEKKGPMTKEEAINLLKKFKKIGFAFDFESIKELISGFTANPAMIGIMAEEMSRVWPSAVALVGLSFPVALVSFGSDDMKERLLPKLERSELIGCYAITEPDAGSDNRAMQTTAVLDGDEYVINGSKTWISNAPVADICMLIAKDEKGEQNFFLVDKEVSPFETSELHKLGWRADPTGEVFFDDCRVPKENNVMSYMLGNILAEPEKLMELAGELEGFDISSFINILGEVTPISLVFEFLRAGMALMATGISQAALDASIKHAKERVQFGKPIGRFQLIQEMLYNMTTLTESSRLLGYRALDLALKGSPEARMASSLAKCYACDAAVKVTYDAIQIHGGNGLSDEYPLERYFRDARMMTIPDGTSEMQKLVVGREILGKGFSAYV